MGEAGLIAARLACYVAMMLAAGLPLYVTVAKNREQPSGAVLRTCRFAIAGAIVASLWWVLESIAAMAALPVWQLDRTMIVAVLEATPLGTVLAVRLIALTAALVAVWFARVGVGALAASLALATLAWTGHAGASEAGLGLLHRASDVIHLLAAATWAGALCLFLGSAIGGHDREGLARQLSAFAATGTAVVLLLVVTGVANTIIIAGLPLDWSQQWSLLLGVKIALFVAMLGLAAANRWRLTPALARGSGGSQRALLLSLTLETLAALSILVVVSVIGTLSPGE